MDKFQQIGHNFNKNYLLFLYGIRSIVDGDDDPKDVKQFELLQHSYTYWYQRLQENPQDTEACQAFYEAVKNHHDLVMGRDCQLFSVEGDFFSNIFREPGLETQYLFECLDDGLETDETIPIGERDPKENVWNSLVGLYRLCVLISVYLKNDLIKEIIDMILLSNPDISQSNIFEKIVGQFQGKGRLRKLIMKLLKSHEDSFSDIFSSLQKVISTFSNEVSLDQNMKKNLDLVKVQAQAAFTKILEEAGVTHLSGPQSELLLASIQEDNSTGQQALVEAKEITDEQLVKIQTLYKSKGLSNLNLSKTVADLGKTMEKMCKAYEAGDEEQIKQVLSSAGAGFHMPVEVMERLAADVELYEKEDEDDEEDEKQ